MESEILLQINSKFLTKARNLDINPTPNTFKFSNQNLEQKQTTKIHQTTINQSEQKQTLQTNKIAEKTEANLSFASIQPSLVANNLRKKWTNNNISYQEKKGYKDDSKFSANAENLEYLNHSFEGRKILKNSKQSLKQSQSLKANECKSVNNQSQSLNANKSESLENPYINLSNSAKNKLLTKTITKRYSNPNIKLMQRINEKRNNQVEKEYQREQAKRIKEAKETKEFFKSLTKVKEMEAYYAYMDYRKELNNDKELHTNTIKAIRKHLLRFKAKGYDIAKIMQTSIDQGWVGLYEPKESKKIKAIIDQNKAFKAQIKQKNIKRYQSKGKVKKDARNATDEAKNHNKQIKQNKQTFISLDFEDMELPIITQEMVDKISAQIKEENKKHPNYKLYFD